MVFHRGFLAPLCFYSCDIFLSPHLYACENPDNLVLDVIEQGGEHLE